MLSQNRIAHLFIRLQKCPRPPKKWNKITEEIRHTGILLTVLKGFFVPRSIYEQKIHWSVEFWSSEDSFITFLEEGLA